MNNITYSEKDSYSMVKDSIIHKRAEHIKHDTYYGDGVSRQRQCN